MKTYKFTIISDIEEEFERQKMLVDDNQNSTTKFNMTDEKRYVNFPDGTTQIRMDIIGQTIGTWQMVYVIVNSIRPQKIIKYSNKGGN